MNISIIIPTKNRSKYLFKLLNYYQSINFTGQLIIIDSSDKKIFIENKRFIESNINLNIKYDFKDVNELIARRYALKYIEKDYTVQSGDDDYYDPVGMQKIIDFLNKNEDYCCASGNTYTVSYDLEKNLIQGISKYNTQASNKSNALERLKDLNLENTPVIDFSIYRSEIFKKILNNTLDNERANLFFKRIFNEYTFRIYSFVYGKCISLDIFYLVRLRVKENNLIASQKIRDIYQNNKKEFFLSYFLLLRKIFQMLEQSKVFDKEVYLLCKKKIKRTVLIRINPSFYMFAEKKLRFSYEIFKRLFYRIFTNELNYHNLSDTKSKKFNQELKNIVEFINRN